MSGFQKAIKDMKKKREAVAQDIGMLLERESKLRSPVKTGHLRRSTNSEVENHDTKSDIFIGTNNVEYATVVHEGSTVKNIKAQPYIKDSIEQNMGEIQSMIKGGLSTK
jgi:predicted transcriptional regulator YdeE